MISSVFDALHLLQEMETSNSIGQADNYSAHFPFPIGLWFRGHADFNWTLEPSIFRKAPDFNFLNETRLFNTFRLRSPRLPESAPTFDWLCLMQHHGLPTRILDWTESLLVALFFAAEQENYQSLDGALFLLNAPKLNEIAAARAGIPSGKRTIHTPEDFECIGRSEMARTSRLSHYVRAKPLLSGYFSPSDRGTDYTAMLLSLNTPIAVFPWRRDERMSLQSSVMTLHGGKTFSYGHDELPSPITTEELNRDATPFLLKLTIPFEKKKNILRELEMLGVNRASLFPELDAQSAFLRSQWALRSEPDRKI